MIYENQKNPTLADIQDANHAIQAARDEYNADPLVAEYAAQGIPVIGIGEDFIGFRTDQLIKQGYPEEVAKAHPANAINISKKSRSNKEDREPTARELLAGGSMARLVINGVVATDAEIANFKKQREAGVHGNK
jgi:hypothetical protein